MKTIILATLLAISAVATSAAPVLADGSLSVHGNFGGNTYGRGMPTLPLTEAQIGDLVAYLITLK